MSATSIKTLSVWEKMPTYVSQLRPLPVLGLKAYLNITGNT